MFEVMIFTYKFATATSMLKISGSFTRDIRRIQSHFWQKSLQVPRDRLLASVVSKKRKVKATSRSFTLFLTFGRGSLHWGRLLNPGVPVLLRILRNLHISLISSMAGRKPDAQVCKFRPRRISRAIKRTHGRENDAWAAKRIFKSRPPVLMRFWSIWNADRLGTSTAKGLTRDWCRQEAYFDIPRHNCVSKKEKKKFSFYLKSLLRVRYYNFKQKSRTDRITYFVLTAASKNVETTFY